MGRAHEVRAAAMAKTAALKSKHNAKYGMAIYSAAKTGLPDPEVNQVLKKEIEKAKKAQIPADVIKRAIDKAKGNSEEAYSEIRYEGFGPSGSLVIVECLTDNANRTYTEIRTIFSRAYSKLGVSGSVQHMFNNVALFSFEGLDDEETLEILAMNECDISDIQYDDGLTTVYAPHSEYSNIKNVLLETKPDLELLEDKVAWIPFNYVTLTNPDDIRNFQKLITNLEELDDVQEVYHNVEGLETEE